MAPLVSSQWRCLLEDALPVARLAPVHAGVLQRLGSDAKRREADFSLVILPGLHPCVAGIAARVQDDADLAACQVVGKSQEPSVLGDGERWQRLLLSDSGVGVGRRWLLALARGWREVLLRHVCGSPLRGKIEGS